MKLVLCLLFLFVSSCFAVDDTGCGSTKNCVRFPADCVLTDSSCMFFSYIWDSSTNLFTMELRGGTGSNSGYVAVAFAPKNEMADAELYYCVGDSLGSGSIGSRFSQPTQDTTLQTGVTSNSTGTNAGVGECTFTRTASITKTISSVATTFDLTTTQYNILLATGTFTSDSLVRHAPSPSRHAFPDKTNFSLQPTDETTATTSTTTTTTPSSGSNVDFLEGCGSTKTCFRSPGTCIPGSNGCLFSSWRYVTSTNTYRFELVGGGSGRYIAIAFANGQRMENADMYYCTDSNLRSGSIKGFRQTPATLATLLGASDESVSVDGNSLSCSFTRQASVVKEISSGTETFDFTTNTYFVFLASGEYTSNVGYHSNDRAFSPSKQNFSELSDVTVTTDPTKRNLIKAHASLMIIAWMTCASIGSIIARHFKPLWHTKTLCDNKVWFQLHRGLMISAVVATLLGFILIFSSVEGYSSNAGAHPIIGIIVTCLAITNPIMAVFRPHPGTPKRPIFNWGHWFVGTSARILGFSAIFLGVDLPSLDLPEWDTWVMVGFVCYHVIFEIIMEILSAYYGHIDGYKKKKKYPEEIPMGGDEPPKQDPPKGGTIKYFFLSIYTIGNLAFVITFLAAIGQQ